MESPGLTTVGVIEIALMIRSGAEDITVNVVFPLRVSDAA
jgi:hypothetical protein